MDRAVCLVRRRVTLRQSSLGFNNNKQKNVTKMHRTYFFRYIVMLHCYPHGIYSLLYSFCYRYYVLSHDQPRILTIIATIAAIYTPSLFQLVRHLDYYSLLVHIRHLSVALTQRC
ncbi:hypothetical protein OESDEN_24677 [Oesophagostomum dentatum]|uniref:Uncharacterized protein n=1 Tax=Oesophagostomum dentatum TaxID=61180 RepID=A0A0B1RWY9_OESDE|nr:hypothetical protein OESDEN_24677 [Oesophagostomum dentatum]